MSGLILPGAAAPSNNNNIFGVQSNAFALPQPIAPPQALPLLPTPAAATPATTSIQPKAITQADPAAAIITNVSGIVPTLQ
jgi:hypothetical protein